jgi:alcohol dehydrogenase class IV
MGQMSAGSTHGFSHPIVHILGPYASLGHSTTACVMMLAQARWIEGLGGDHFLEIKRSLGRPNETFSDILLALLEELELPTTLEDLGVDDKMIEEIIPLALAHPTLTRHNVRPIKTAEDIRAVFELAR